MRTRWLSTGLVPAVIFFLLAGPGLAVSERLSGQTVVCLKCHNATAAIVNQWQDSVHWNAAPVAVSRQLYTVHR